MALRLRFAFVPALCFAALALTVACRGSTTSPATAAATATAIPTATAVPILKTVRAAVLAGADVQLSEPSAADLQRVKVTQQEAEAIARQHWQDGSVTESALANYADTLSTPPFKCRCWVVVRDLGHPIFVSSGPPDSPYRPLPPLDPADQVHVDAIDAVTGKYIESAEGGINFRTTTAVPEQP